MYRRILIFSLIFLVINGCKNEEQIGKEGRHLTDLTGRSVFLPKKVGKIICLAPGTLRLIVYLKAQSRLVGIERFEKKMKEGRPYWIASPELSSLPVIGPGGPGSIGKDPDMEAVMRVRPDVIFISSMSPEKADSLQKRLKIPVVVLSYGNSFGTWDTTVYDSLRIAAIALGKEKRADEVINFIESTQKDIIRRGKKAQNPAKVYAGAIGFKGLQGIESSDSTYWPFAWTGANNIVGKKGKGHLFINKESLLAMNPDIIFIDGAGLNIVMQDFSKKRDYYRSLKAFKAKKVFSLLPFNFYLTNIGTVLVDGYAVGRILKRDAFGDIEISRKAAKIYTFLVGKDVYRDMKKAYGEAGSTIKIQAKIQAK